MNNDLSLVIFTCTGREKTLIKTYQSFNNANSNLKFYEVIIAIDGNIEIDVLNEIKPDRIIQNFKQSGYFSSIKNVIPLISTEYFFWLEDDWTFPGKIDLNYLKVFLEENRNYIQIRFNSTGRLTSAQKTYLIKDDIYKSDLF